VRVASGDVAGVGAAVCVCAEATNEGRGTGVRTGSEERVDKAATDSNASRPYRKRTTLRERCFWVLEEVRGWCMVSVPVEGSWQLQWSIQNLFL